MMPNPDTQTHKAGQWWVIGTEPSFCPGVRTLSHQGKYAQYPVCLFIKHGFSTYYVPGTEPSEACNTKR